MTGFVIARGGSRLRLLPGIEGQLGSGIAELYRQHRHSELDISLPSFEHALQICDRVVVPVAQHRNFSGPW